jgi:hypothetical protein
MSDPKIGAQPHETPKTHPADDGPKATPNASRGDEPSLKQTRAAPVWGAPACS